MAKPKTYHKCKECGYTTPRWVGQCPGCLEWNTMEEVVEMKDDEKRVVTRKKFPGYVIIKMNMSDEAQ